jgi:hypothetical protein
MPRMSKSRTLSHSPVVLVMAVLGACVGVFVQVLRIANRVPEFRSLAKVSAEGPRMIRGYEGRVIDRHMVIVETLGSSEMRRRALERVRSLHPELQDKEVEIRVFSDSAAPAFSVLATASEPRYAQIFLGALLDEFIAFEMAAWEQSFKRNHRQLLDELEQRRKQTETASQKLETLRAESLAAVESTSGASVRKKEAEAAFAAADLARRASFATVEAAREQFKAHNPFIAVLERPTPAMENIEDWVMPFTVGAIGGGLLGALVGLLLAWLLVCQPRAA